MEGYVFPSSKLLPAEAIRDDEVPFIVVGCGSYNPITIAHVELIKLATASIHQPGAFGEVFANGSKPKVVGCFVSPVNDGYKKAGLAPFPFRAAVCRAALQNEDSIAIDEWEGRQPSAVRTYVVLKHIHEDARLHYLASSKPQIADRLQVCFVCGADLFGTFYKSGVWDLALLKNIFTEFFIAVASRVGCDDPVDTMRTAVPLTHKDHPGVELDMKLFTARVLPFQLPPNETSSTLVRQRVADGGSLDGLVTEQSKELLLAESSPYRSA